MTKQGTMEIIEAADVRRENDPLPAVNQPNNFFETMAQLASRPDVPVEKLERLMQMQEHILDRDAEQQYNADFTKAQSEIDLVVARKKNLQTKSNYASLGDILVESKDAYTKHGFSLSFYEGKAEKEGCKRVCVDIMHRAGHTKTRFADLPIQTTGIAGKAMMTEMHGIGSAFSYGRRYLTCLIFNIPTGDDDDGNKAGPVEYITVDQVSEIKDLIKETKSNMKIFLKVAAAESIETITADKYKNLIVQLKTKQANIKPRKREPGDDDQ